MQQLASMMAAQRYGCCCSYLIEMNVSQVTHTQHFILAKTSHDGSSSVIIKPIIERLFCSQSD
jgi:hypothetical protein